MQVKRGFSLMELLVALAVSSVVVLSAYVYYGRNVHGFHASVRSYFREFDELASEVRNSQKGFLAPSSGEKRRAYRLVRPNKI